MWTTTIQGCCISPMEFNINAEAVMAGAVEDID